MFGNHGKFKVIIFAGFMFFLAGRAPHGQCSATAAQENRLATIAVKGDRI